MIIIRRFNTDDAVTVSEMIARTLRVSNSADYASDYLEDLVLRHSPEFITDRALKTHFYVIEDGKEIVGCGAIGKIPGKEDESRLYTVFVSPEKQGKGLGRRLIGALEKDELFIRARRVEVPASITALEFYKKLGYVPEYGVTGPDANGLYRLEKIK